MAELSITSACQNSIGLVHLLSLNILTFSHHPPIFFISCDGLFFFFFASLETIILNMIFYEPVALSGQAHFKYFGIYMNRRDDAWFAALGRSCIHMTWSDRGAISLEV